VLHYFDARGLYGCDTDVTGSSQDRLTFTVITEDADPVCSTDVPNSGDCMDLGMEEDLVGLSNSSSQLCLIWMRFDITVLSYTENTTLTIIDHRSNLLFGSHECIVNPGAYFVKSNCVPRA